MCDTATRDSGERLGLEGLELRLVDGSAVQESLRLLDLTGRTAGAGDRLHVLRELLLVGLRPLGAALRHASVVGDDIDEDTEERQEDQEDDPEGLDPARGVMTAE